ncbi:hypothetical protein EYC80_001318 [Monilinia laxa]|uniref:FAD/NAD(P)-binding domain-containing protein n=1 Tax=Monilinia laxa TaxID=61186 RepID=A0A5N6K922_MONLA|nr:hypothetical protein EYC80_001318 [Monilinia laxa]
MTPSAVTLETQSTDATSTPKDSISTSVEALTPATYEVKLNGDGLAQNTSLPYRPTPQPNFEIEEHPIDIVKPVKVAVIGAGLAGINAGILLPAKVPGIQLTIFEKNADVGGTWFENIYPGWSEEYAQGKEIREYWQGVARKHNVYNYLKFNRKIVGAVWNENDAQWNLSVENLENGEKFDEQFDVVITAIGRFNAWKLPDYPGIGDYKGHLRHSSNWDPNFDPTGKTVAVIGNGASGLQVVPNLQKVVKHLDHYARSKTWIAGSFGGEGEGRTLEPKYFSEELLKSFEDPETYHKFRKDLEGKFFQRFSTLFKGTEENKKLEVDFRKLMAERLKKKPELLDEIVPDFAPNCRRLTPGPGYLEALTEDNVSFIRTPIERFTEEGIVTTDGVERKVDAIICSTGANIDMRPPFPITAFGQDLRDAWDPDPLTYLGVASPSFPNLVFVSGPNAHGTSGTVPNQTETQITYIAKLLRKVSQQSIKTFVPSKAATDDFIAYSDAFFPRTVWTGNCKSWGNSGRPGGRIHGHWPGSASHVNFIRKDPRWEDWEWTYKSKTGNRFAYLGNGWTVKETIENSDRTPYLKRPDQVDLRSYHEEWFEGL